MTKGHTIFIGIGNQHAGDDGVGLYIAHALKAKNLPETLVECQSGEGALLMASWENAQTAIIFDAVHSNGSPGKIYRFDPRKKSIPERLFNRSSHNFGVSEAVALAKVLNRLPPRLIVYGIEGHCFKQGTRLSPEMERAAQVVLNMALEEISSASFRGLQKKHKEKGI